MNSCYSLKLDCQISSLQHKEATIEAEIQLKGGEISNLFLGPNFAFKHPMFKTGGV